MKTIKLLPATLLLPMLLGMVSCEEKDSQAQFEIYENHEITACAVKDPLKNYTWLSEFIEENRESTYNIMIYLYANAGTKEDNIVIDISPNRIGYPGVSIDIYEWKKIFSCEGDRLFVNASGGVDNESWNNFFYSGQNSVKGVLWSRLRVN
jgi:hypothetical protein